ncbi:PLP-dependent aminotransferase family protein [Psychrobacter sp. FBL11]|uniref:PLP-dependent aminotransferase family protein n=1 Tax=Psychrobacter saeujeotis TaxID=3143436 RepID=A0ABU9X5N6_9GAMM|nr:PLP-dependent aminotransferase family protein [uncultured Psychrobacter sp.]
MKQQLTRIEMVMADVKEKIATVTYMPGSRLPSVRAAANSYGFSPSTIMEAYERLQIEGVIYSRPGAGFYVAESIAPLSLTESGHNLDRTIDPLWVSRQSLEPSNNVLKPGCGWLPPEWLFEEGMRRGLRHVARGDATVISEYATPLGLPPLRQLLTRRMAGLGIDAQPSQVVLTESGTQAIDLILRFLLTAGDTVVVDDPCYFNFRALLRAHRVKVIGVPYTPNGPDAEAFVATLNKHKPRLYITNAAIHNPTGATLSPSTAYQVLQLAQAAGLYIIEDDIFADFEVKPAPRLAALDGLSRVFYIGSFSKTLSASLRCGYIAAPNEWVESLLDLKVATGFGGDQLAAAVVLSALTDSGYRKHMNTIHTRLARARNQTLPKLAKLGIVPWLIPQAGMFLWCRLPDNNSATQLANNCLSQGVVLAPGNAFSQSKNAENFMRFNVAQAADARIYEVLADALN